VDHTGTVVDGDHVIAICARDLRERGLLHLDTVVVTVMANLGFRLGMRRRGISVRETAVGDRYVLEALESGGWSLGGEQSGHVIFRRLATTGDGLLTGVQVLDLLARSGRTLADLADDAMTRLPQVLRNVRLDRARPGLLDALAPAVSAVEARLGEEGRVLIRPSGTEPLIRVMVEATDETTAQEATDDLVRAVEALLNGG
jgi:phosphoglucosamine mutase